MLRAEECDLNLRCCECNDYSKTTEGLEICKQYSTVVFAGEGNKARKEILRLDSEIADMLKKKQIILHDIEQKKMNGEQLTEDEEVCYNLFCQYNSLKLDLRPWAKDGCVPECEDGRHIYQFLKLVKQIKAYFEEGHCV